ncbi:MAG: lema family protein, partial [Comamonadaceae bacterium]
QLLAVLDATRSRPLEPAAVAALGTALHVMLTGWQRLHPDAVIAFAADGTLSRPAPLQHTPEDAHAAVAPMGWPEPTALIEIQRDQFNQAVAQYNAAIHQFPAVLLAWVFRWRSAAPLL